MHRYTPVDWISWGLTTVGAINWGLVGLSDFNLVHALFGRMPTVKRIIYSLVGVAGLYSLARYFQIVPVREEMAERIHIR